MLTYALRSASAILLLAANAAIASPVLARSPYVVKDSHNVPSGWRDVGPAPSDTLINLHVGLKQGQYDELERHLYEGTSTLLGFPT